MFGKRTEKGSFTGWGNKLDWLGSWVDIDLSRVEGACLSAGVRLYLHCRISIAFQEKRSQTNKDFEITSLECEDFSLLRYRPFLHGQRFKSLPLKRQAKLCSSQSTSLRETIAVLRNTACVAEQL